MLFFGALYTLSFIVLTITSSCLTLNGTPSGYILGTKNSEQFYKNFESSWLSVLREKYPLPNDNNKSPDSNLIRLIHKKQILKDELKEYPAHLHIDLLPSTQGKGLGRKMINKFIEKLKSLNISALHLEVGKTNLGAIEFYKRMGFHEIEEYEYSIAYGMKLNENKPLT